MCGVVEILSGLPEYALYEVEKVDIGAALHRVGREIIQNSTGARFALGN